MSTVLDDRKDLITRLSGDDNITVTYFEGLNVLVRIPGTSRMSGAILLSAHIDSVSTAPGATVNPSMLIDLHLLTLGRWNGSGIGNGIGSLFCATSDEAGYHREPKRRRRGLPLGCKSVFSLCRIELTTSFANHPWAREVVAFVNLEGAGAGYIHRLFCRCNT